MLPGRYHCLVPAQVNAHGDSRAISLLTLHPLDVDDTFLSVPLDSLADLLTFVVSSNPLDLVVLADGHGADVVLLPQLLGEWRRRDLPAPVGRGTEVPFAVSAAVRGHEGIELHGARLQREAREGAKERSAGYHDLLSMRDTAPHHRASALGRRMKAVRGLGVRPGKTYVGVRVCLEGCGARAALGLEADRRRRARAEE